MAILQTLLLRRKHPAVKAVLFSKILLQERNNHQKNQGIRARALTKESQAING